MVPISAGDAMTNAGEKGDAALGSEWHLDKRVPIALIVTIIMQSMAAVWWAATMQERMDSIEKSLSMQSSMEGRMVRIEQIVTMQTRTIDRMENKLDRVIERENGE